MLAGDTFLPVYFQGCAEIVGPLIVLEIISPHRNAQCSFTQRHTNTLMHVSKLNRTLKLTTLPLVFVCQEVLKHNTFHFFLLELSVSCQRYCRPQRFPLRSWINQHTDRRALLEIFYFRIQTRNMAGCEKEI